MGDKKVLVVVSHGSKRRESNQEFENFIEKLNKINQQKEKQIEAYQEVRGACLEFASPQLETVIKNLLKQGYKKFDILPLFIFGGYHVRQDIPERLQKLKSKFEQLNYRILEHPAAAEDFADYIFRQALAERFSKID